MSEKIFVFILALPTLFLGCVALAHIIPFTVAPIAIALVLTVNIISAALGFLFSVTGLLCLIAFFLFIITVKVLAI